jgi:hypothetical protein
MFSSTGNEFPPFFMERNSGMTSKQSHLRMEHVQTAYMKLRSPNRLASSLLFYGASINQNCISGSVLHMIITINTETIAFTEKTFRKGLCKAAIAESNGNLRLEIKVANSEH